MIILIQLQNKLTPYNKYNILRKFNMLSMFLDQVKRNIVALISLAVAVSSLSYNTWRDKLSEDNRNQRFSAFQILLKTSDLQSVIFYHHYEKETKDKGNLRTGWSHVLLIDDLANILPEPMPQVATELKHTWKEYSDTLENNPDSHKAIDKKVDALRNTTLQLLKTLK